jgi:hypothetical protein
MRMADMKDKSNAAIRKLEADAKRIVKQRERHDAKGRKLADEEKGHEKSVEALILGDLRAAGFTKLPLSKIIEGIKSLGRADANSVVGEQATLDGSDQSETLVPEAGQSKDGEGTASDTHDVIVKISGNTSADKRSVLEESGLRWNGRLGVFKGPVNGAFLKILEKKFGDRLTVLSKPATATEERGSAAQRAAADVGTDHGVQVTPPTVSNPSAAAAPAEGLASTAGTADASTVDPATEFGASSDATIVSIVSDDGAVLGPSLPAAQLPKSPFANFARRPPVNR